MDCMATAAAALVTAGIQLGNGYMRLVCSLQGAHIALAGQLLKEKQYHVGFAKRCEHYVLACLINLSGCG